MGITIEKVVEDAGELRAPELLASAILTERYAQEVFKNASVITEGQYDGGMWHLKVLSNGGFFMALDSDAVFTCFNHGNYTSSELSGDAFSVAINMAASSHLSFWLNEQEGHEDDMERVASNYHLLREYAYQGNDDPEDGDLCDYAFTPKEILGIYNVLD